MEGINYIISILRDFDKQTYSSYDITRRIDALEASLDNRHSGDIIDHSKSILESISKTILAEHGQKNENIKFPKLVKLAYKVLVEKLKEGKIRDNLISQLNMINQLGTSIATLRNDFAEISHGREAGHEKLEYEFACFHADSCCKIIQLFTFCQHKLLEKENVENELKDFHDYINKNIVPFPKLGAIEIDGETIAIHDILRLCNQEGYDKKLKEFQESREG